MLMDIQLMKTLLAMTEFIFKYFIICSKSAVRLFVPNQIIDISGER